MAERMLGKNLKRLMGYYVAKEAIPAGGGMQSGIDFLLSGKIADASRRALDFCDQAVTAIRSAPDNPYGDDEETICGAILSQLDNKVKK